MNNQFSHCYCVGPSKIHGDGLIAKSFIYANQIIGVAIDGTRVTADMGKWVNHCYQPNAQLQFHNNRYYLVALKDIDRGQEIVANYHHTPHFIKKPESWYR